MDRLNVGIIGDGVIGDAHGDAISKFGNQSVVAVAEPVDTLRKAFASKFGGVDFRD